MRKVCKVEIEYKGLNHKDRNKADFAISTVCVPFLQVKNGLKLSCKTSCAIFAKVLSMQIVVSVLSTVKILFLCI